GKQLIPDLAELRHELFELLCGEGAQALHATGFVVRDVIGDDPVGNLGLHTDAGSCDLIDRLHVTGGSQVPGLGRASHGRRLAVCLNLHRLKVDFLAGEDSGVPKLDLVVLYEFRGSRLQGIERLPMVIKQRFTGDRLVQIRVEYSQVDDLDLPDIL